MAAATDVSDSVSPTADLPFSVLELQSLKVELGRRGVTNLYADYWLSYPLTFDHTHGQVASPVDLPRVRDVQARVDASRTTTWVVYRGSRRDLALQRLFNTRTIAYQRSVVGEFSIYTLAQYLNPLDLGHFWVTNPPGK